MIFLEEVLEVEDLYQKMYNKSLIKFVELPKLIELDINNILKILIH
jgi:hypothetical protein